MFFFISYFNISIVYCLVLNMLSTHAKWFVFSSGNIVISEQTNFHKKIKNKLASSVVL